MIRLVCASVLAFVALSGCFYTTLGGPCETSNQCQAGQECLDGPGGFCSRGCTEAGQTRDCPNDSVCTLFGKQLLCSDPCNVDRDCREGYQCVLTHVGGNKSACAPKPN